MTTGKQVRKRPKPAIWRERRPSRGLHLAIDHGPARSLGWPMGSAIILFALAAIAGGFIIARSRIPARTEYSAHDPGPPFIPGTTVRFGEDQPAPIDNDEIGEAIDPDRTEQPAPETSGRQTTGDADVE